MTAGQLFSPALHEHHWSEKPVPRTRVHHFEGPEACISVKSHDSLHLTGTAALEEDAQILKVIEAYCTSASFPQGHGSSRFPQPLSLMSDVSSLLLTASWKKSKATQMGCRVWKAGDLQQRSGYKAASFR